MNSLTLNGVSADFVYQKNLNTVQKRHHVRLWKEPSRADVWLGAAAEDIAFRFELMHWTHSTASKIDSERAKVVNDLAFTRCLDAAGLVPRDFQEVLQDPKGERLILTAANIAVVRLNSCTNPRSMPGADVISRADGRGRLSRGLAALRNDLRLNVVFTTYNTLKLITERRTLKPLRKAPSTDADPPGLGWLSSLPTREQSPLEQRPPDVPTQSDALMTIQPAVNCRPANEPASDHYDQGNHPNDEQAAGNVHPLQPRIWFETIQALTERDNEVMRKRLLGPASPPSDSQDSRQ